MPVCIMNVFCPGSEETGEKKVKLEQNWRARKKIGGQGRQLSCKCYFVSVEWCQQQVWLSVFEYAIRLLWEPSHWPPHLVMESLSSPCPGTSWVHTRRSSYCKKNSVDAGTWLCLVIQKSRYVGLLQYLCMSSKRRILGVPFPCHSLGKEMHCW